jgi:hypothetical protein
MKYMLLIHHVDAPRPAQGAGDNQAAIDAWEAMSDEDKQKVYAGYQAINQTPGVIPGHGMQPPETATTVRVQDGRTLVTDGPFVEAREAIGGYCVYEADDLDAAIELAARIPAAWLGGAVEVRPVMEW